MSLCDIEFDGDYDNDNEFYVEKWRTARKPHQCCECRSAITPGERYLVVTGRSNGSFWTVHLCAPCNDILHEFTSGSWTFGELWQNFEEQWDQGTPLQPCLNRMGTVAAKTKLRDQWLAYKADQQ